MNDSYFLSAGASERELVDTMRRNEERREGRNERRMKSNGDRSRRKPITWIDKGLRRIVVGAGIARRRIDWKSGERWGKVKSLFEFRSGRLEDDILQNVRARLEGHLKDISLDRDYSAPFTARQNIKYSIIERRSQYLRALYFGGPLMVHYISILSK
jgi:hypothetical protein